MDFVDSDALLDEPNAAGTPGCEESAPLTEERDWIETGAASDLPAPSSRPMRGQRLRFGPVTFPVAAVAWGSSITVHAAAVVAIALFVGRAYQPASVQFGLGDGASELLIGETEPSAPLSTELPSPAPAGGDNSSHPADQSPRALEAEEPLADAAAAFESAQPRLMSEAPQDDPPLIGVGLQAIHVPEQPSRRRPGAAPASPHAEPAGGGAAVSSEGAAGRDASGTAAQAPATTGQGHADGGTPGVRAGVADHGLAVPSYPPESRRRREQGEVRIEVEVLPDGRIGHLRVLSDPGFPRLVEAALAAIRKSRFTPARENGRPVAATVTVPFHFTLR
jgi:protein TonB